MLRLLILLVLFVCCGTEKKETKSFSLEEILFGGGRCDFESECISGMCSNGICLGYLMVGSVGGREVMMDKIRGYLTKWAEQEEAKIIMSGLIQDETLDPYLRARALEILECFPKETAVPILLSILSNQHELIRFSSARILHRLGDLRGTETMKRFLDHPSDGVRSLASITLQ